ncbi:MAG: response regulator [Acidobacteriota bacterium]|nr:response regulator [Acidobacteriota bacterium]
MSLKTFNPGEVSPASVLVVDDNRAVRDVLREGLEAFGYLVESAPSAVEARKKIEAGATFDLVLCDIDMPGMSGTEFLAWLKDRDPEVVVMMVTGIDDAGTAVKAMLSGASDYLCKPFSLPEVKARTEQALEKRRLVQENRAYQDHLERLVQDRTHEVLEAMSKIRQLNVELRVAYDHTLSALMIALDYRDNETQGHSVRVVEFTERIGGELGILDPELTDIRRGAMLHDVGKIGIPDDILRKPGPLDADEWEIMRMHPDLGHRMLKDIAFLERPAEIVLAHQEKWDGSGYPNGLSGEAIPIGARIFAAADTFDAMTSDRPYRKALPYARARDELIEFSGTQFDPSVVEAFLRVPETDWGEIRARVGREMASRSSAGLPKSLFARITATKI